MKRRSRKRFLSNCAHTDRFDSFLFSLSPPHPKSGCRRLSRRAQYSPMSPLPDVRKVSADSTDGSPSAPSDPSEPSASASAAASLALRFGAGPGSGTSWQAAARAAGDRTERGRRSWGCKTRVGPRWVRGARGEGEFGRESLIGADWRLTLTLNEAQQRWDRCKCAQIRQRELFYCW